MKQDSHVYWTAHTSEFAMGVCQGNRMLTIIYELETINKEGGAKRVLEMFPD